ncbi:hypothetical protein CAB17_14290 [Legionella sainthelensi]|uniref:Uncharacterized protein n=2 Tax=Legionella sainthelensi TaxID=28087 RepID=A0A2H5FNI8_9GAMM|nr:hypothetical protein CAB17_14290 [Legionella sainthelensi]
MNDPHTREAVTNLVPLPHIKEQINQFLTEQEAIKKYFECCLERGFRTKQESMARVSYDSEHCFKP